MRSGSSLFYSNNGLGRRIFENPESLHTALKRFADKQDDSIGDCTDIAGKIDPFSDNQGAKRLGTYLHRCLEGLNANMGWETSIREANADYAEEWGHDKITNENAYEK
jgi:ATP-dependent protease HslVU (ClpYQ) ATPase subunit